MGGLEDKGPIGGHVLSTGDPRGVTHSVGTRLSETLFTVRPHSAAGTARPHLVAPMCQCEAITDSETLGSLLGTGRVAGPVAGPGAFSGRFACTFGTLLAAECCPTSLPEPF